MYLTWGNIFYPKRGQLIVECFFPKYPLHLVHIVFKAHYDLIAFPTALEYSVESPLYFWACSITINNSLKILLKHKCMEIRIECSFRNHLTQLCTNVARSLYSVSTTFWNFLAAQMVAFSTVWPQPILKKVRTWWQIPPQDQSTHLGGPESASIEIPPFRPHFIKF